MGCVELWHPSLSGALGPGVGDAARVTVSGCSVRVREERRSVRTTPRVVVHDENPIKHLREGGDVVERVSVRAGKGYGLHGGAHFRGDREGLTEKLEEGQEVGRIVRGDAVAIVPCLARVLPIDVDSIQVECIVEHPYVIREDLPALRVRHSRREVSGRFS